LYFTSSQFSQEVF